MAKKKTNEEFLKEVYELVDNEYTFLEEYIDSKTKIKVRHNSNKCNYHEYEVKPSKFIFGQRCPKCSPSVVANKLKKSHEYFISKLSDEIKKEYTILTEYKSAKEKIRVKHNCKDCNYFEYEVSPDNLMRGRRCPECFGTSQIDDDLFKSKVFDLVGSEYTFTERYNGIDTKIKVTHNKCNHEYYVSPYVFINMGCRCPNCKESKGEKEVSIFLDKYNIKYERQYTFENCKNKRMLPFDFCALSENGKIKFLIEYQGEQHYNPYLKFFGGVKNYKKIRKNDYIKKLYCEDNNIKLLIIPHWDFDNIEEILKNELEIS